MFLRVTSLALAGLLAVSGPSAAAPLVTPMQQAVAQAASADETIAAFYRGRDFAPVWMGEGAGDRRAAFLWALDQAEDHGLPAGRYDAATIRAEFAAATDPAARGALEVAMTERFLRYAQDVSSGVVDPRQVDPTIVLNVPKRDWLVQMTRFVEGDPYAFVQGLWPASPNYTRLLREKLRLEEMELTGGWGATVSGELVARGSDGRAVVDLRNRLVRMGYLRRSAVSAYDAGMEAAVRAFQIDHGLTPDGEAGEATLAAINVSLEDRKGQILVGLERQRWMNKPLEPRHILVNLAEQHAYVYDDGKVTFDTVVVVGADTPDRRTPEFSHTMTHMVINPYWHVPRSITVNEYLPALRRGGAQHLEIYSRSGRVNRSNINFSNYTARNFPFSLKQPPGPRNALGRVKFMFPNQWNIYLHDTPSRNLFSRDQRTFSHGCVRVGKPLELAYHLLAPQTATPESDFATKLRSGRETRVNLQDPIGVHLVYWSAWVTPTGRANYRGDPYGRDIKVLRALQDAGVELDASRS
ncbi:Murein L,D-transpeptidase YcbB/YkuD [Jannaschia faecimaris]|uniref:Murein L,D-transpeptidase YcbB/YkuD n=1 Tax=Jannaschia faecimaris TaxID=1244108 RepID=A0A1H3NZL6_9RHOB|nr:L,D-transpeptidase family protein [Jannaschia faecimaris]SDY94334.1 Murein L,D-transpeptidase YcbB/YkuD [Jannaschia faecimaris]